MHKILLLAALGLGQVAQGQEPVKPKTAYAQEFSLSFLGKPELEMQLVGPDAEQCVQFTAEGLRITLPAGHEGERPHTGVRTGLMLHGDFEVTVSVEMLQEPDVSDAGKAGTKLHLVLAFDKEMAGLTRQIVPWRPNVGWTTWLNPWQGKQKYQAHAATARRARLRLVRSGGTLSYAVAEDGGPFQVLAEYPCLPDDVTDVRLSAATGGPQAALDARITDLQLRADALPNAPGQPRRRFAWRLWVGLGVLLALACGVWLARPRSRRTAGDSPESGGEDA